ncbi:uncharacterized protein LOC125663343 [Ostrea edulis]|uniref:uncharacterized protein LOC125663343 n=1 Tax=Ostrea edulis TaxID=37623 RepID=UPI0024AF068D|nr:uncharacterized protein LOC125663343 [Ostrea edulis]
MTQPPIEIQKPRMSTLVDNDVTMSAINLSSKKEDKSPDLINGLLSWAIIVTIFLNVSVAIVINLKIKIRHAARNGFDYTQLQNMSVDTPGPTSSTIPPTPTPPSPQPSVVSTPATVKHSFSLWLPVSKNTNRQKEIEL